MTKLAIHGGEPVRTKPFHAWPIYGKEEEENLINVLRKNKWGVGQRVGVINEFEKSFSAYHEVDYAVACTNCTQALEVALSVSGVCPGDEVIVPAYTFIATASAVAKLGAIPIFADINDKLLIDPESVESLISWRTKAVVPVHFAGQMADLDALSQFGLVIIEDAAQAHGARSCGICPGHYGSATFSFQYSKNMTAGEGGIIVSDNKDFIEACWEYIWHGRKKGGLWYEHFQTTSNYRMTEWSAAVLLAQLERLEEQNKRRTDNANYLTDLLNKDNFFFPPVVDPRTDVHARHLFPMRINRDVFGDISKDKIVEALTAEGIPAMPGYGFPLYRNPAFVNNNWGIASLSGLYDYKNVRLKNSEEACKDIIWILHNVLLGTHEDMDDIMEAVQKIEKNVKDLQC